MNSKDVIDKEDEETNLPFTGVVVAYNDARRLRDCLNSLSFCTDRIVIDLGSTDDSTKIAREFGAKVIDHEWVPVIEYVRQEALNCTPTEWVIFLDPDEVFPVQMVDQIRNKIRDTPELGSIKLPWQFYYLGKPLKKTRWGQNRTKAIINHKKRVTFTTNVHQGKTLLSGFTEFTFPRENENDCIQHYWVDSRDELREKHQRYLVEEGRSRYNQGQRFSWFNMAKATMRMLAVNLFYYQGILGGRDGIYLSFFYAWYVMMGWYSLRKYEKTV